MCFPTGKHTRAALTTTSEQMIPRPTRGGWQVASPAKLNLTLNILGKRPDGFHDIHSAMIRIGLYDTIRMSTVTGDAKITLTVDDRRRRRSDPMPIDHRNLIVRALTELQNEYNVTFGGQIHLTKRIPSQAGLGGGSSNAAAALVLGNRAWELDRSTKELSELAARIGSDVPFFLANSPSLCEGLGNVTTPIGGMPKTHFVVAHPPIGLATQDVYGRYSVTAPKRHLAPLSLNMNPRRLGQLLCNDLQSAAEALTPWIRKLKQIFARLDLVGHQMSGSGTAYFGICRSATQARRVAGYLNSQKVGDVFYVRNLIYENTTHPSSA